MELTKEVLLSFQGLNGFPGLAHVRLFEESGRPPVAVVGRLTDAPGTMVNNGIEMVAESVRSQLLPDGREFELVTYHPGSSPYSLVTFKQRSTAEDPFDPQNYTGQVVLTDGDRESKLMGAEKVGSFRDPSWQAIEDIDAMLGMDVEEWERDDYTLTGVFGEAGARAREEIAAAVEELGQQWSDALG